MISGPGGVGKGTVVDELLARDRRLWLSRSWTTRKPRPGEAADAYVFVDEADFSAKIAADGFLEWTKFEGNGCYYGTPLPDPPESSDVLLEIELDGAGQVKNRFPHAVLVLIVAPSAEEQEARMRGRGDDEVHIARRLAVGAAEEALGRSIADHVVVNDDVAKAAEQVEDILARYRASP